MRPVLHPAAARFGAAVPGANPHLSSSAGLGAMTAALVIVPVDPACARPASAHRGQAPGSRVDPREVLSGAPWMVRLSMGSADMMLRVRSAARLAPGQDALPGARR